ncbi:c-type cytochrome [Sedimenticola thiotaurini]|uniref:Cytochrome c domain-containing protein n=1 Tax=Sedimenticola thiotaurini TaxID=1543721 RepID=A0A0F7JTW1_9GAMM|nr:hypothetical protein [Sedimenticola thiotaurini]AKH19077.1 hypothetical protein AAY24_00510 [Sedimenticola thiotaurini]
MSRFLIGLVAGIALLIPATVISAGEQQRRFTVELALLAGDSRLLQEESLSVEKRRWIEGRITSALNVLPLLARQFLEESGLTDNSLLERLGGLQQQRPGSVALLTAARELSQQFPIPFPVDFQQPLGVSAESEIKTVYQQLCLGCHITSAPESSVVIGNFGSFARSMPDSEWLARLLGGLRGDAYTGYENPFSDAEIAALFRYTRDELP